MKHSSIITDIKIWHESYDDYCPFYLHTRKGEKYMTWEWEFLGLFRMEKKKHIADQDMFACKWWSEGRLYTNNELKFENNKYEYRNGKFINLAHIKFLTGDGETHVLWFHNDKDCSRAYEWMNGMLKSYGLKDINVIKKSLKDEFGAIES